PVVLPLHHGVAPRLAELGARDDTNDAEEGQSRAPVAARTRFQPRKRAVRAATRRIESRSTGGRRRSLLWTSPRRTLANQTSRTGFSALPPSGPAIPVMASASSLPLARAAPRAIASTVSRLTAPCARRISPGTPSTRSLASFA